MKSSLTKLLSQKAFYERLSDKKKNKNFSLMSVRILKTTMRLIFTFQFANFAGLCLDNIQHIKHILRIRFKFICANILGDYLSV